jgi:tetratricopeptide (TPR) repeat protein
MDERTRENLTRGREHYAAREYGKAEAFLAEIVAETKYEFADVFDMLGVIYHQQGRLGDAEAMFRRALKINPNYTEAALNLAVTFNDLGKYAEAKEIYGRALLTSKSAPKQLDPFARGKIANMHADVGGAYHDVGQYVVEAALGLRTGFWGLVERGATFRSTGRRITKPGRALIVDHRADLDDAERIAGEHLARWHAGDVTAVSRLLTGALDAWRTLEIGDTLVFRWPEPTGVVVRAAALPTG